MRKEKRDHRKSYGLEFIDIRREIDRELKTLEVQKSSTLKKKVVKEGMGGLQDERKVVVKRNRIREFMRTKKITHI